MKAPTKKEALEGIRRHVYAGELRFKFFEDALDLIETMGVPFSPERVAPHRGDLLTEATELVDDMIVRTSDGYAYTYRDSHDMWFGMTNNFTMPTEYLIGRESVIRDVPGESDPEPELVAERRDDGNAYVGIEKWGSAYFPSEYYRQRADSYAAVARLREQEEREAVK